MIGPRSRLCQASAPDWARVRGGTSCPRTPTVRASAGQSGCSGKERESKACCGQPHSGEHARASSVQCNTPVVVPGVSVSQRVELHMRGVLAPGRASGEGHHVPGRQPAEHLRVDRALRPGEVFVGPVGNSPCLARILHRYSKRARRMCRETNLCLSDSSVCCRLRSGAGRVAGYVLRDLGDLGFGMPSAVDINELGQAVFTVVVGGDRFYLWDGSGLWEIQGVRGLGINDRGQVAATAPTLMQSSYLSKIGFR